MSPHMGTLPLPNPVSTPTTPSKLDGKLGFHGLTRQSENADFDYYSEGYLSLDFRVKFLTWYSLKATKQDRRVNPPVSMSAEDYKEQGPTGELYFRARRKDSSLNLLGDMAMEERGCILQLVLKSESNQKMRDRKPPETIKEREEMTAVDFLTMFVTTYNMGRKGAP
ncbi:hypothetical protein V2J09_004377 [Rumex salicifolius]